MTTDVVPHRSEIGFQPLGWGIPAALLLGLAGMASYLFYFRDFASFVTYLMVAAILAVAGLIFEFARLAAHARANRGYRIAAWPFYLATLVWSSWFMYSLLDRYVAPDVQFRTPGSLIFAGYVALSIAATWKVQTPVLRRLPS